MQNTALIQEPFTAIPNALLEKLISHRLPGEQSQVLDYVIRNTFGWHCEFCEKNIGDIAANTGLKKPNVCRAIRGLFQKNILIADEEGNLAVNTDFDKWLIFPVFDNNKNKTKALSEKAAPVIKNDNPVIGNEIVIRNDNPVIRNDNIVIRNDSLVISFDKSPLSETITDFVRTDNESLSAVITLPINKESKQTKRNPLSGSFCKDEKASPAKSDEKTKEHSGKETRPDQPDKMPERISLGNNSPDSLPKNSRLDNQIPKHAQTVPISQNPPSHIVKTAGGGIQQITEAPKSESPKEPKRGGLVALVPHTDADIEEFEKKVLSKSVVFRSSFRDFGWEANSVRCAFNNFMKKKAEKNQETNAATPSDAANQTVTATPAPADPAENQTVTPEAPASEPPKSPLIHKVSGSENSEKKSEHPIRYPLKPGHLKNPRDREVLEELNDLCVTLDEMVKGRQRFNPFLCVRDCLNVQGFRPEAVIHAMKHSIQMETLIQKGEIDKEIHTHYGLIRRIAEAMSQKFNEREHISRARRLAEITADALKKNPELANIAYSIGRSF